MTHRSFADQLDHLFRTVRPSGRAEYSYEEVAEAIRSTGVLISHTYIWQLRKGKRDNPTKRHIEALAHFFGVAPTYFFDPEVERKTNTQLELLSALRDHGVHSLALRAVGLSPGSLAAIEGLIDQARRIEGLPLRDNGEDDR